MKRLPLVLIFAALPAYAQITVTPEGQTGSRIASTAVSNPSATNLTVRRAEAAPTDAEPTPAAKKQRGIWGFRWLFKGHKKKEAAPKQENAKPSATAEASPAHARKPQKAAAAPSASPSATPKPAKSSKASKSSKPTPTPDQPESARENEPAATTTPTPTPAKTSHKRERKIPAEPSATPAPPSNAKTEAPSPAAPASVDFDKARYLRVKQQAARDPDVTALGAKVNAATAGSEEYKEAATHYSKALFSKMREIDPAQAAWVDRMEAATHRRIESGKPFVVE